MQEMKKWIKKNKKNSLSWQNIWNSGGICWYLPFLIKQNEPCHGAISSQPSGQHRKSNFDFTEVVSNHGLKQGTVCQTVRFISQFYLKLNIQL